MQKVALIILISFFSVWDLFPQVTIKEKVEIKPKEPLSSASTSVHTIVFNLQWDRPGVQATVVGVSIPCQSAGADWQYGGSISLTVDNARAGLYWFQPRVNQNPYDTTNFYFQLYFDGVIVRNGSAVLIGAFSSGSYPYFNVQYTPPLVSDYSFNLSSNELCYREFGELIIHTSNNCATGVSWNSTDLINLSITIGQELASFYHYDFSSYFPTIELLGDNIEVTLAELADISLEQDNLFNGSNVKINVQAEWGGVIKTDSATAYPASEYVVSAESFGVEEINSWEEVFMELNVLDLLNCGFCLPLYETYNAEIIKGGEYGSLIDPETGESVQSLTGIEQFTFGPGIPCGIASLDYISDGISADTEDSIIIRISTSDPQIQSTDKLFLIQPSPVYVDIIPDTISPGDTASVVIKKRNPDGTIEDFPPDQFLEVGMLTGCTSGTMVDCYDGDCYQDTYLFVLPTDSVYFIADSSADSGVVKIRVGVIEDGGGGGASIAAQMDTSGYKRKGKVKPKVERKENRSLEEKAAFIKNVKSKINNSALSVSEKEKMFEKLNNIASPNSATSLCFVGYFAAPIFGNAIVSIQTDSLDYFEITIIPDTLAEKDTLAFAETAKLIIQAKNADSTDIEFNSNKLLTLRIETNEEYGTFINANGDTLKTTPVILNDISYGDARNGFIKFAAVKENPDSVVKCLIKVSLQEDTTKAGEQQAVVLEQTLKIEMEGASVVRPTYFNSYGVRVGNPQLSQKLFDVKMTRGGKPVSNHPFKIFTNYVNGSGGHDHVNQRPNNDNNYGYFLKPNDNEAHRPLEESTSVLGRFDNIIYNASYFGDIMRIYLESTQNRLFIDSIDILERIPDLVELQEGNNYELVGAPQNHSGTNDPCRPTPPLSQHSINHFGTQQMLTIVQNIANDYAALHPGIRIRVNDMSLEYGGLFDGNDFNNWLPPHQSHRMGTNADISYRGIDESDICIDLNLRDLRIIIDEQCITDPYPENNHYHIYE